MSLSARLIIFGVLVALIVGAATSAHTPDPVSAAPHPVCPALSTQAQLQAETQPCRDLFVIDPGVGAQIQRTEFLQPSVFNYYRARGFSPNFLWYAPSTTITVPSQSGDDPGVIAWAGCSNPPYNPLSGHLSLCPPSALGFPHINSNKPNSAFHNANGVSLDVIQWPLGPVTNQISFIGKVCGNFSVPRSGNPVPRISGVKFDDLNGNGVRDGGEPGLGGWTIQLHNSGGGVVSSAVTDGGGFYQFGLNGDSFGPDTYSVTEVGQSGWVQTRSPGTIGVGIGIGDAQFTGNDFGNFRQGSLSGRKFEDMNGNGQDDADPGRGGWTVLLTGTDGRGAGINDSRVTDGTGSYTFSNVAPGNYTLSEVPQGGWVRTYPASGSYTLTLISGQNLGARDFGNYQPGSISGRKFEDLNGNGADNGDPGVVGWPIQLTGTTGAGAPIGPTTVATGANGVYSFGNLAPGLYSITEGTQTGWEQSFPQPAPPGTYQMNAVSGENKTGRDFGNYRYATVTGRKYEDRGADGSGVGDPGLPNWLIHLDGLDGLNRAVSRTVTTEPSGDYMFTNVSPGNYTLTEEQQAGWNAKEGAAGHAIAPLSGDTIMGQNFGNWRYATVQAQKYDDLNGNGVRDGVEPGIAGWDIHLNGTDGMGTAVSRSQTTDAAGNVTFSNLVPGSYALSETLKNDADWVQTAPASPGTIPIQPVSNDTLGPLAFGNLVRAEVHGAKFNDLTENGVKDAGTDVGLAGWQINLDGTDGMAAAVQRTTTTAADGTYAFVQIMPGNYTVCEVNPDPFRWYATRPSPSGSCYAYTLASHDVKTDVDFGNYDRASIEGIKFSDHNKNGARDAIDEPLDGWVVTLTDCTNGNVIPQAASGVPTLPGQTSDPNPQMTHAGGVYKFSGLHNGQYCVSETLQTPSWVQTKPCFDPAVCGYTHAALLSGTHIAGDDFGNFQLPPVDKTPQLSNLFICESGPCAGAGEGHVVIIERVQNVHTGDQNNDGIEDGLGAYEFMTEFDNFAIQSVNPMDIVFSAGGAGSARGPAVCTFSIVTENFVRFGCVTTGQTPGPTGNFDLAKLDVVPAADDVKDLFPGNDNGIPTIIKDNGCELVDVFGHPIIGAINGGLTPFCNDAAITVRILEGDLNLDCKVDVQDEAIIAQHYGAFFGSALYQKWLDLEPKFHDLDIDIKDLQKVFGRDGSTCQMPIPAQTPVAPVVPLAP